MKNSKSVRYVSILWISSLIGAGSAFLLQIILARSLGPEKFGLFASALALVTVLVPLAGFSISQFWLKAFGLNGWQAVSYVKPSLVFVLLNSLLVITILSFWAIFGPHKKEMTHVLLIMNIYIIGQVILELIIGKFQLEERYSFLSFWQLLPHATRLFFVFIVLVWNKNNLSLIVTATIFAATALIILLFGIFPLIKMSHGEFDLKGHNKGRVRSDKPRFISAFQIARESWPFGLAGIFHLIYFQSDIILVKYLASDASAGNYQIAFTIIVAALLFPSIVYQKYLLPKIHRWANYDKRLFYEVYRKGGFIMLCLGVLTMITILVIAPYIIPEFFGFEYQQATTLLSILSLSIPALFIANTVGAVLVTQEHMKLKVKLMGGVALINIILNLLLIPSLGANGAAISTVISNYTLLALYYTSVRLYVFTKRDRDEYQNKTKEV